MSNTFFLTAIDMAKHIKITDIIDILIVAYGFYKTYELIKQTRAEQLVKGILILLFTLLISDIFNLYVVNWILRNTMTVGLIAIIVVFQPEFRRILENLGRTNLFNKNGYREKDEIIYIIEEVAQAGVSLSRQKIGALIVFERKTGLGEIIQTGTSLDATISRQLIINLFIPNTPLHDGAVVIRDNKIAAASCYLPLTENRSLNKELGTRHRAAIGVTEKSDSICFIVSEETGYMSIALDGKIYRDLTYDQTFKMLENSLIKEYEKKRIFDVNSGEEKDEDAEDI